MSAISPTEDLRPFDLSVMLPNIETLRDTVATMALCGETFKDVYQMLEAKRASCITAIEEEFQHRTFDLRRQITAADEATKKLEELIAGARRDSVRVAELQTKKLDLQRDIAAVQQEIRKTKTAAERH